jgi:ADP-heptose:LPS heptosyltransferase
MKKNLDYLFNKIAVLRANSLGDFIFILPALQALRETYPKSEITYLGKQWHKEFLQDRPSPIDKVIVLPPLQGVGESENYHNKDSEFEETVKQLKQVKFDIAIQLHGGGRYSNSFINKIGAKITLGLRTPDAEALDISVPYIYYQNEYLRYLEVVGKIGATTANLLPKISVLEKDFTEAKTYISNISPYIVLHPGASDTRRRWSTKNFSTVGDYFANHGYRIVITGIKEEENIANEIIGYMEHHAYNLCGQLTLSGLIGLLAQADLVISNDTGPLHLAEALGIKSVGLYWCTNLINAGFLTRENSYPLLSWTISCPICHQDMISPNGTTLCTHETSFLNQIKAHQVIDAANSLLISKTNKKYLNGI